MTSVRTSVQKRVMNLVAYSAIVVTLAGVNWNLNGLVSTPSYADDEKLIVTVDKVEVVNADRPATVVQVGNPKIADVNVASAQIILVIGISVGETSLLLLDKEGQIIKNISVEVVPKVIVKEATSKNTSTPKTPHRVTIHQGTSATTSLDCDPSCSTVGDSGPTGSGTNTRTTP